MKVTYREAAQTDLIRQFRYYLVTLGLPDIAFRFRESVRSAAGKISSYPRAAAPYMLRNRELQTLRSWPVSGFATIRLYFLVKKDALQVIRILHGKQNVRRILEREKLSGNDE